MNGVLRVLPWSLILICSVLSTKPLVTAEFDHLAPIDLKQSPNYRRLLASRLGVTPFNCGRATLLPAFDPEGSVSVYWVLGSGHKMYRVTFIEVAKNLYQRTDGARYPARAKAVKDRRLDTEIPERTALVVREVWLRMLRDVKPISLPTNVVVLDATIAEFSLEMPTGPPLRGELNFSFSYPGKKTKPLVDIWNALYEYCKATVEERSAIANQIERKSIHLLETLRKQE